MPRHMVPPVEQSLDTETVLSLLSDEYVSEILEALTDGPATATELTEHCSGSKVTVYRRLNSLEENDLVEVTTDIKCDGHHCKVYRNAINEITVAVTDDGPELEVVRTSAR
ncbi:ArsR/SmtB family transcription factor [Natronobacterium texcoconense]|uniref:Helix-turn-helix domain-containing protein n=1 Tax=Natronobacterium texcoconense TaxID=1095778 RepID=A0A1H1HP49_NATTX|nr:winged helix-turn-helix domain-containing protein [Natronobacterium texcoconense]SDR27173.1 Helix-turn-helix domain-containing protein [Natronobacterium texcoconense]